MYRMRAEPLAAKAGLGVVWHALDRGGNALCGRGMSSCTYSISMNAVATTAAASSRGERST